MVVTYRRIAVVASLVLCSAFALVLLAARIVYTGTDEYRNLAWNLVLAWVPFVLSLALYDRHRRGASAVALLSLGALWLLFLPNAPYLLTDIFLLRYLGGVPIWFDVVLVTAFAWTGLLLGFISLYLVQAVTRRIVGSTAAWGLVAAALALSSFGIYLGRFLRWNSWDFVLQPTGLAASIWERFSDPVAGAKLVGVTVLLSAFLSAAYFVLYSFLGFALHDARERARPR